jgi:hypothetical protein
MELEPSSSTRSLLEELREWMTTRETSTTRSSSTSHRVVRVFASVEASFQV